MLLNFCLYKINDPGYSLDGISTDFLKLIFKSSLQMYTQTQGSKIWLKTYRDNPR